MQEKKRRPRHAKKFPLRKILVMPKKTRLTELVENDDRDQLKLVYAGDRTVADVLPAHEEHERSMKLVLAELERRGIKYDIVQREQLHSVKPRGYQLMLTCGGDGTVLHAAQHMALPVLGVNTAVSTSVGHFCLARPDNLSDVLDAIIRGEIEPLNIMRLQVELDGKVLDKLALNEVFMGDPTLGANSRYIVTVDSFEEAHRSDGLFVGTAAGSTAWMHSYQCEVLPIADRVMQVMPRGLITPPGKSFHVVKRLTYSQTGVRVVSQMDEGLLLVDGRFNVYPFRRGSVAVIRPSKQDVRIFVRPDVNLPYLTAGRRHENIGSWH